MTQAGFDRAKCGAMNMNDLAAAFEALVGEPPEKRNKLWMLKRMEQAAAARAAVERAADRASRRRGDGGDPPAPATAPSPEPPPETAAPAPPTEEANAPPVAPVVAAPAPAEPARAAEDAPASAGAPVATHDPTGAHGSVPQEPAAPEAAPPGKEGGKALRRRYIPARFRAMTLAELHAEFAHKVGRPTKSSDVPYLCWRITRAERAGTDAPAAPRRSRRADGTPRGEAKAVTLREYPDTLAAVEQVCGRHNFRNRLEFFRRAARHFLDALGEREAATYFADEAPPLTVSG